MGRTAALVSIAVAVTVPGLLVRLAGIHVGSVLGACIFAAALVAAGFLLSWGAEAAEQHVSQGLVVAGLALITVLPEYAVDIYYALEAGRHPDASYVHFAAANMTGANRLLIGVAWPLIVLLYWWRAGRMGVDLRSSNSAEIVFLGVASLYNFVITMKGTVGLLDMVLLFGIYGAYLVRVGTLPKEEGDEDEEPAVGPVAAIKRLPRARQYIAIAGLASYAALVILALAEPFAESLVAAGATLGINQFLLVQWVAPLASEAAQIVITVLFTLRLMPTYALGALVSDKINQWTLLVGMLPLFYSIGAGHVASLPLDARQHEEFFLTASQSLFAVALLMRLRLGLAGAVALLGLFLVQFGLGLLFRDDEARTIRVLTAMSWLYLALAAGLFVFHRGAVASRVRTGLLGRHGAREDTPRKAAALD